MNGYPYGYGLPPNQNNSMPATGPQYPPGGRPYPPYVIQQPPQGSGVHNYNVPPPGIPAEPEHVNNGHHHLVYPLQPIIVNQEIAVPGRDTRQFTRSYVYMSGEHVVPGTAPPPYRGYLPNVPNVSNVPVYAQDTPAPPDCFFRPIQPEHDYHVNTNSYRPLTRPDAVWAPNQGDIYNFGDMLSTMPPVAPRLLSEVYAVPRQQPILIPLVTGARSSPVARAVGGPVSGPGAANVPTVSANGPRQALPPASLAVGAGITTRERLLLVQERLAASAQSCGDVWHDDIELEEGLQALERRIDTEFKMAD